MFLRIDAKSSATYRGDKFKKSDILMSRRALKFEGTAYFVQDSKKMTLVTLVVLTDILFFLTETRDQKYMFFPDNNKATVVSLQKLLVREKAGHDDVIYLISNNLAAPEMFELKVT